MCVPTSFGVTQTGKLDIVLCIFIEYLRSVSRNSETRS